MEDDELTIKKDLKKGVLQWQQQQQQERSANR